MGVYVRGWAWCVRTEGWSETDDVCVFRYAAKPRYDGTWWAQDTPDAKEEGAVDLCSEGFYAATGLGPSDLPLDTPVKVRFGNAEVID